MLDFKWGALGRVMHGYLLLQLLILLVVANATAVAARSSSELCLPARSVEGLFF